MKITDAMLATALADERNRLDCMYREDVTTLTAALGPAAAQDMLTELHAALVMPKEPGRTFTQHQATVGAEAMCVLNKWIECAVDKSMVTFDPWIDARERLAEAV
jgi:hypothetical protein